MVTYLLLDLVLVGRGFLHAGETRGLRGLLAVVGGFFFGEADDRGGFYREGGGGGHACGL